MKRWLLSEPLVLAVLTGSFLSRWLIADRNSYWLDELYSVATYGVWNENAFEAVRALASSSVHPPLYQFTLYHWMSWFGDSEVATRSLSNLYVTVAALFLYLALRYVFSRRLALASVIAFSLMYTPMYYGLEARSYAQTIFLVSLSSYLLARIVHASADRGWRPAVVSPTGAVFTLVNIALLLTHYYNVFFWVAQAVIAGLYVLLEQRPRMWLRDVGLLAGTFAVQGALFLLVWGRAFFDALGRRAGDFAVEGEGGLYGPIDLLLRGVVSGNINPPLPVALVGLVIAAVTVGRALVVVARGGEPGPERSRALTIAYIAAWLVLPLVVVYVTFSILGVARYNARYFVFSVMPLAPLMILAVDEAVRLAGRALGRRLEAGAHALWSTLAIVVVLITLIAPGTYAAATEPKDDWRGIVGQVVDLVQGDEEGTYIIFQTAIGRRPLTDYYFERLGRGIRAYDTVQRDEESQRLFRILTVDEPVISQHDYLILIFTHSLSTATHFPEVLERLEDRYDVHHRQLDDMGRGFIVFDVHSADLSGRSTVMHTLATIRKVVTCVVCERWWDGRNE